MKARETFAQIVIQLALIIIGVFTALAVENWRESIAEKKIGREYLINLREAVQSDTAMIKAEIKKGFDKENAAGEMLKLIDSGKTVDSEEFEDMIENILVLISPACMTTVYDELKSTGNLKLIRNNDLKKSMIVYYSSFELLLLQVARIINYNLDFMDAIDYGELTYRNPFSQETILARLRKSKEAKRHLRELQKIMFFYHQGMIYNMLPKSLELLDKINRDLESQ